MINPSIYFESEKHFEDFLFENKHILLEYFGDGTLFRQIKIGRYGICDIIMVHDSPVAVDGSKPLSDGNVTFTKEITIIELKNAQIEKSHNHQCDKKEDA